MSNKVFARIQDLRVVEVLASDLDPRALFNPQIQWVDISDLPLVQPGWTYDVSGFSPPDVVDEQTVSPTLAILQARIQELNLQLAALLDLQGAPQ